VYTRHCAACDREFTTSKTDVEHCANCRGATGSARRRRGGSAHGRQQFRYAREDGQDFTVSFAVDSEGHSVTLQSIDGEVRTPDAEIAKRLEALGFIAL
jgi:DnaJ-class molecular chaperone